MLNGNGELTGLEWVRESGRLTTPIALTNTHSVGVVRDALVAHSVRGARGRRSTGRCRWSGRRGTACSATSTASTSAPSTSTRRSPRRAAARSRRARSAAGTGMICHGFKGGIGTASRVIAEEHGGYTVGVLVQANHGWRERLTVAGVPVGRDDRHDVVPDPTRHRGTGRGLDHRRGGDRRAAAAAPVPADRPARLAGDRAHRRGRRALERRHPDRVLDRGPEPAAERDRRRIGAGHRAGHDARRLAHHRRSTTRRSRPPRPRSSTACWPPRRRPGATGSTAYGLEPELLLEAMRRFGGTT